MDQSRCTPMQQRPASHACLASKTRTVAEGWPLVIAAAAELMAHIASPAVTFLVRQCGVKNCTPNDS
jgi:hypothetical protein